MKLEPLLADIGVLSENAILIYVAIACAVALLATAFALRKILRWLFKRDSTVPDSSCENSPNAPHSILRKVLIVCSYVMGIPVTAFAGYTTLSAVVCIFAGRGITGESEISLGDYIVFAILLGVTWSHTMLVFGVAHFLKIRQEDRCRKFARILWIFFPVGTFLSSLTLIHLGVRSGITAISGGLLLVGAFMLAIFGLEMGFYFFGISLLTLCVATMLFIWASSKTRRAPA
ncbi:MAG: hypothetical protein ABIR24_15065 [Verrucomicrobiota bacterium]